MKTIKISMISLFAAAALLGAAACGGDEPDTPNKGNGTENNGGNETPTVVASGIESVMNDLLNNTSCKNADATRMKLIDQVQKYSDACSKADYDNYYKLTSSSEMTKVENSTPILSYYHKALNRVVSEVKSTTVPQGHVYLWHLYNMGYVVKTPSHCFGIDIKHRDAIDLVPYMEFLLITHEHSDHYTQGLNDAMKVAGKAVYSNFVDNDYKITGKKTIKPVDGIEIVCALADHSAELKNFCVTYQIDCGADAGNQVIYHIGDTYNAAQLAKTKDIDIFIPHGGINMNFTAAFNKIDPKYTLVSHMNELSHAIDNYRWAYSKAFERVEQWAPHASYVPVWGEKIDFVKE